MGNLLLADLAPSRGGCRFRGFLEPEKLPLIEQFAGFPAVSAHNGRLDMLPSTGAFGLAIVLAFYFCAPTIVKGKARRHDPPGWLAFLSSGFYVLQSPTLSIFTKLHEITLIVVFAVLGLPASGPPVKRPRSSSKKPTAIRQRVPLLG